MGAYSVLTDLMAHPELGGKTVLYMLDGLLTAPGESVNLTAESAYWQMPLAVHKLPPHLRWA